MVFICDESLWEMRISDRLARRRTARFSVLNTPLIDTARGFLACAAAGRHPAQVCTVGADQDVRQITWMPEPCVLLGWAEDGRLVFTSSAGQAFRHISSGWLIDLATGATERLASPPLAHFCAGGQGRRVIGSPGVDPRGWRGYAGGARGEIWLDDGGGRFTRVSPGDLNVRGPLLVEDRIFFVGDAGGASNLWSCALDGTELRQHTFHRQLAVHSAATDGRRIVYCVGGDLYLLDPGAAEARLDVRLQDPLPGRPRAAPFAVSPSDVDGSNAPSTVAYTAFGQLFESTVESRRSAPVALPGVCSHARYLPDGALLTVLRNPGGDLLVRAGTDRKEPRALSLSGSLGRVVQLAVARSGTVVVLSNERHQVLAVDLGTGQTTVIDTSLHRRVEHVDVSPDGDVCTYALPTGSYRSVVRVARSDGAGLVAETEPPLADLAPRFSPDGQFVYFLSILEGDGHHEDLVTALHRLELDRDMTALIPTPAGWFADLAVLEGNIVLGARPVRPVTRQEAAEPFTPLSGAAGSMRVWGVLADRLWHSGGSGVVVSIGRSVRLTVFNANGRMRTRRLDMPSGPDIDPVRLRTATFDEAWRLARDHIVAGDPDTDHWNEVHACYSELAARARGTRDIHAVINEMLGNLRVSHAIVRSPGGKPAAGFGLLGVGVRFDQSAQAWRVERVPSVDPRSAQPPGLAGPGLGVAAGGLILEVAGQRLGEHRHPSSALAGKAGRRVKGVLETESGQRTVEFIALRDERALYYGEWTLQRRRLVAALSGGTVGYLHLADVSERTRAAAEWWLRCHDEVAGLVIDLRYNEGGTLAAEICELLCRSPVAYLRSRWSLPRALPAGAGRRRMVVVANRFTSSGGELLAEMLRAQKRTPIVGEPTLGAGTGHGITRTLPDGSELLLPELEVVEGVDSARIENRGVVPDVLVGWCQEPQGDPALAEAVKLASPGVTTSS